MNGCALTAMPNSRAMLSASSANQSSPDRRFNGRGLTCVIRARIGAAMRSGDSGGLLT